MECAFRRFIVLNSLIIVCNIFSMDKDKICASVVVCGSEKNRWGDLCCLMIDKSSSIELAESFLKRADLLEGKDLNFGSIRYIGLSPNDEVRLLLPSRDVKIVNFLHSVMLRKRLKRYKHEQDMLLIYNKLGMSFW